MRKKTLTLLVNLVLFSGALQAQVAGDLYSCAGMPKFIRTLGLQQPVAIDTTLSKYAGLAIREMTGQKRIYQKPSWKTTGHLGTTVRDASGSIYLIPIPSVSLDINPLSKRNTIYRVRSQDGEIEVFAKLPMPSNQSQSNPFGVVGIALDCETNSLYVSSVAASTPRKIAGTIYQIDLATGRIVDKFTGVDALGLGAFRASSGKRLYYGDARSSSLYSLRLNRDGGFKKSQRPTYELSLLALKNGDSTQVRKIKFGKDKQGQPLMMLSDTEFAFRLAAETTRTYKKYVFSFDVTEQRWVLLNIQAQ